MESNGGMALPVVRNIFLYTDNRDVVNVKDILTDILNI